MSRQKLRVKSTPLDNLISNLRGEIGEVITSWVLWRYLMSRERELRSGDIAKDLANESLVFVGMLRRKLADETVARLSELSQAKIGRLTFHFAATKLATLSLASVDADVRKFSIFVSRQRFEEKRNCDISHKALPEQWAEHKYIEIPYRVLLRGIAGSLRLMKKIDGVVMGPSSKYLWREMRKRRYQLMNPASAAYMMLPYLNLSRGIRERIVAEEIAEGRQLWSEITTAINGQEVKVPVCRQWGTVLLDGRMLVLDRYPLQQLTSLNLPPGGIAEADRAPVQVEPITAEKQITAKYRLAKRDDNRLSFEPVQRQHQFDNGTFTELVDIHVNLDEKLRQELGAMKVGDERDFTLTVTILVGFRPVGSPGVDR